MRRVLFTSLIALLLFMVGSTRSTRQISALDGTPAATLGSTLEAIPSNPLSTIVGCDSADVKEWMIQRQVGRNRLAPIYDKNSTLTFTEAIMLVQDIRRNLEDLKRPQCADELYILTIYDYDNLIDYFEFASTGKDNLAQTVSNPRIQHYIDTVNSLYFKLQAIAGVNVQTEAAKIQPVPTQAPTEPPLKSIHLEGKKGGVVLDSIDIPTGIYKMVLTGESGLSVSITTIRGVCGSSYIYVDSNQTSVEKVFQSKDCRAVMEIGQTSQPWTLDFKPVS